MSSPRDETGGEKVADLAVDISGTVGILLTLVYYSTLKG
jgi:hypothetical protein